MTFERAREIPAQTADLAEMHIGPRDVLGPLERLTDAPGRFEVRFRRLELPEVGEHEPEDGAREALLGFGAASGRSRGPARRVPAPRPSGHSSVSARLSSLSIRARSALGCRRGRAAPRCSTTATCPGGGPGSGRAARRTSPLGGGPGPRRGPPARARTTQSGDVGAGPIARRRWRRATSPRDRGQATRRSPRARPRPCSAPPLSLYA